MSWSLELLDELKSKRKESESGGGVVKIEKEHAKGKLTARERMSALYDEGRFTEIEKYRKPRIEDKELEKKRYYGDGVVCGYGKVNGITVYAASQDATVSGGAGGEAHVEKICRTLELAIKSKKPFVQLCDSGGARIEEGIRSLSAYSRLFWLNTQASGYIPQIAAIMGNCAGGSAYSPAMCDLLFMVEGTAQFFITGPKVIKALTGEEVTMDELGGTDLHAAKSGQAGFICKNDSECINRIREVLHYITFPKTSFKSDKKIDYSKMGDDISEIVPQNKRKPYDVKEVIENIADNKTVAEISGRFAPNLVTALIRIEGRTVGVVANQAMCMGGAIDCDAADKCSRFVRFCDCFDIPLLVLVDVPGFFPGLEQEKKGILRHGSKILYSFAEATVPKVSIILRKAYGGAYCAMNSKDIGADIVFAWPLCELAVMGGDGAVDVIYRKTISESDNPEQCREKLIEKYDMKYLNPYYAASCGFVDEVIEPNQTRSRLIEAFGALEDKHINPMVIKKHGNIAL